jgi:hypothetical protein
MRSVFESELNDVIPVVYTSVAGCRIIGTLPCHFTDEHVSIGRTHASVFFTVFRSLIRKLLGLPEPDPLVGGTDPDHSII